MLTVKDLTITLKEGERPLVFDVTFSVREQSSLIILGQSGSGKTLVCKTLTGILNRQEFFCAGEVFFAGRELLSLSAREQREIYGVEIALIPQNPMTALDPSVRVGKQMTETLYIHAGLKGAQAREKVSQALREAGLERTEEVMRSYPYMLSGGMLQRVLIAMALMMGANLIVADEPTTALDAEHRNATVDALIRLRERGVAVLLVTHDFAVASRMGGDLVVMKDGRIVEHGRVDEVLSAPKHAYTQALIEASRLSGVVYEEDDSC